MLNKIHMFHEMTTDGDWEKFSSHKSLKEIGLFFDYSRGPTPSKIFSFLFNSSITRVNVEYNRHLIYMKRISACIGALTLKAHLNPNKNYILETISKNQTMSLDPSDFFPATTEIIHSKITESCISHKPKLLKNFTILTYDLSKIRRRMISPSFIFS